MPTAGVDPVCFSIITLTYCKSLASYAMSIRRKFEMFQIHRLKFSFARL